MSRTTRNTNSSKRKVTGGNNRNNSKRTTTSNYEKPESSRKSVRSVKASPAPSAASSSASTVSNNTVTRSLRKRAPLSPEEPEPQASSSSSSGCKRRRISVPPSPDSSVVSSPAKPEAPSGRKRRGHQKGSPPSRTSTVKRARVALQSASPESEAPQPASPTTLPLKRQWQTESAGGSGTEPEEEDPNASSNNTTVRKRGAKRGRMAPRKSTTPKKNAAEEESATSSSAIITTDKEEVTEVIESTQAKEEEVEKDVPVSVATKNSETVNPSLSKKELLALQRRQLLQRLDHYDLSDLVTLPNLLSAWPESELRTAMSATSSLPITASQRLWISAEGSPISRTTLNGDSQEADTVAVVEADLSSAKRARCQLSPVPHSNSRTSTGDGGVGHGAGTAAKAVEKGHLPRFLDTFCVASFSLPTWSDTDTAVGDGGQGAEHERLIREISAINPDVFCVTQARADYATSQLRPELTRCGYQCSGCTDGAAGGTGPFQSFIFFSREVFSEVACHRRPVQSMARKLVEQSAYPQPWRDALSQSLAFPGGGDSGGEGAKDLRLLVSVLRHLATGSLLLVGCLTESLHTAEFPSQSPLPPPATTATVAPITVPHVECAGGGGGGRGGGGCCASTVTVSVAGCHSSLGGSSCTASTASEWCPPSFDSRPDLATITATGCLWALQEIWQELQESAQSATTAPLLNGYNGAAHPPPVSSQVPMRWVLCANLEASPSSPTYQIIRDGYPSDESISRLRVVRNIHLRDHDFLDAISLLDLLWHAFQHPCTDVRSCYHSVMGMEPPFTRYATAASSSGTTAAAAATPNTVEPRKCVDYIFCSGSSLLPRQVLVPPCRATLGAAPSPTTRGQHRVCSTKPLTQSREVAFALASRIAIMTTPTPMTA